MTQSRSTAPQMSTWITSAENQARNIWNGAWISLEPCMSIFRQQRALQQLRGQAVIMTDEQVTSLPLTVLPNSGRPLTEELAAMIGPAFEPDPAGLSHPIIGGQWRLLTPSQDQPRQIRAGQLGWGRGLPTKESRLRIQNPTPHWPWEQPKLTPENSLYNGDWTRPTRQQLRLMLAGAAMRLAILGPGHSPGGYLWSTWEHHARDCASFIAMLLRDTQASNSQFGAQLASVTACAGPALSLCSLENLGHHLPDEPESGICERSLQIGQAARQLLPSLPSHEWRSGLMAVTTLQYVLRELMPGLTKSGREYATDAVLGTAAGNSQSGSQASIHGPMTTTLRRMRQEEHLAGAQGRAGNQAASLIPRKQRQHYYERMEFISELEKSARWRLPYELGSETDWQAILQRTKAWWDFTQNGGPPPENTGLSAVPAIRDVLISSSDSMKIGLSTSSYTLSRSENETDPPSARWVISELNKLDQGASILPVWKALLMRLAPGEQLPECHWAETERRRQAFRGLESHLR